MFSCLDNLHVYANKRHLTLNTDKTHIVVVDCFLKRGKVKNFEKWTFMNTPIKIADEFCYLGISFYIKKTQTFRRPS